MAIDDAIRKYLDSQMDYYTNEAQSYQEIIKMYVPEIESVPDATFGMIAGCVYSAFLNTYQARGENPSLEDIQEFGRIMKDRAPLIKRAIIDMADGTEAKGS